MGIYNPSTVAISASIKQPVGVTLSLCIQCNCYPICGQDSSDLQDLSSISCASKNKKGSLRRTDLCFCKATGGNVCRIVSNRMTSSDDTELGVHPITAKEYASQCHELYRPISVGVRWSIRKGD